MSSRLTSVLLSALLWVLSGCGGDEPATDAGAADANADAADGGVLVTPPDIPWLEDGEPPIVPALLTPCPMGWHEVAGGRVTECEPYLASGSEVCTAGEAHFPGEVGCRPVGDACPPGDWPVGLPGSAVVYVKADAPTGGNGTLAQPYSQISEVSWSSLTVGATVALAKGTYEGALPVRAGVTVIGACARETILTGLAAPVPAVVTVASRGEAAVLRNLTIADAPQRGVRVDGGRALSLRGVVVARVRDAALEVTGRDTVVVLEDTVLRDTDADALAGTSGPGLTVADGAQLDATRLLVSGNQDVGVEVIGAGTEVTLVDAVVQDTRHLNGSGGIGVDVRGGAYFTATRLLVSGNRSAGIFAGEMGTRVMLTDVVAHGTRPAERDGSLGFGAVAMGGAHLEATRLKVSESHGVGIFIDGAGSTCLLADVVVRDTESHTGSGHLERGINVQMGAHLEASRVVVEGNRGAGIFSTDGGTKIVLIDAIVAETRRLSGGLVGGRGINVQNGSMLEGMRLLVTENQDLGLFAVGDGSTASLIDAVVRDTGPRETDGAAGDGIAVQDGAQLTGARLLVAANHNVGMLIFGSAAAVDITDTIVRETQSRSGDGGGGRGIAVHEGRLEGDRIRVEDVRELAVSAVGGGEIDLHDVAILRTVPPTCSAGGGCPESAFGHGAASVGGALRMTRFEVRDAVTCGVIVLEDPVSEAPASIDLSMGIVAASSIGACVQVDGYNLGRLTDGVRYVNNETPLDNTSLPVPVPLDAIEL